MRGLSINSFDGAQIRLQGGGSFIEGNFIGTDLTGTADVLDGPTATSDGVLADNAPGSTIGGLAPGQRNLISGNGNHGVALRGNSGGSVVAGNYIGTTRSGMVALGNDADGVSILAGSNRAIIGRPASGRNVISGNQDGVSIDGDGIFGTRVQGNYIGTGAIATTDLGNRGQGVDSARADDGVIGGSDPGEGNVISGNNSTGVNIRGDTGTPATGNRVEGNRIGTNAGGTAAIGNGFDGIQVHSNAHDTTIGGLVPGARNVISGNGTQTAQAGIFLGTGAVPATGAIDNRVLGNHIGTNAAGTAAIGNRGAGIINFAPHNDIGGAVAGARNVVSGNARNGIELFAFAEVRGNHVGVNAAGTAAVPNLNGILAESQAWIGESVTPNPPAAAGNVISGNRAAGLLISEHGSNVEVNGNLIGTNAAGTAAVPNADGIVIRGGGFAANIGFNARNVISGNDFAGVHLRDPGTQKNKLVENYIGLTKAGTGTLPNAVGVEIATGASDNSIGDSTSTKRNHIAGNRFEGVRIRGVGTSENTVQRAWIGLRPSGARVANETGVEITQGAEANTVGAGNVISGNTTDGVRISGAETSRNVVVGNVIGATPAGTAALANAIGVNITDGARFNTIGGPLNQPRSQIAGNSGPGVRVAGATTRGNRIQGNLIGTQPSGATALANGTGIVVTAGAQATTIGGTGALGNRIGFNTGSGVLVDGSTTAGAELVQNGIFSNGGLGIDLRKAGELANTVTPNDLDDPDTGPNALQNFPVITAATGAGNATTISGTLNSGPRASYRVEVFRNPVGGPDPEAATFTGAVTVVTNSGGDATWTMTVPFDWSGRMLRATATRVDVRNTSELSAARTVG